MKYLKKFETQSAYEAAESNLILPNVSLTVDNNTVYYKPYVEPLETRVIAKFNVTDTTYPMKILNQTSAFSSVEIDGVEQPSVVSSYTFSTTGEHTVKYTLVDPTTIVKYAFRSCNSVESIYIPSCVTSIGDSAFESCSNIVNATLPNGVTSIGSFAFYDCRKLVNITIEAATPPILDEYTFYNTNDNFLIYVPSGSVDAYKAANNWSSLASRIQAIS